MDAPSYATRPIGYVQVNADGFSLAIDQPYRAALTALEGFSHINVLWWCHELDDPAFREMLIAEKPYKQGPDEVGVFATRSPARPNPIALTAANLVSIDIDTGILTVAYLDANNGSPILDIKPYLPAIDRVRHTHSPEWCSDWPEWQEDSATFDWSAVFENAQ